jgi:hypothetical protein
MDVINVAVRVEITVGVKLKKAAGILSCPILLVYCKHRFQSAKLGQTVHFIQQKLIV